jgi:CHASE1-domain containing sensor protein
MSFITEIKRRKVHRAAFIYLVMAWLILQIADVVAPILDLPGWVLKLIFFSLMAGLPIILFLSWQLDFTNLGVYREKPLTPQKKSNIAANHISPPSLGLLRGAVYVWVIFLGVGLSGGAAIVVHLHEVRQVERGFQRMAVEFAHEIRHNIKSNNNALNIIKVLFAQNKTPNFEVFKLFSEEMILRRKEMKAVEWVPRVTNSNKELFINEIQKVYPGFEIKTFDTSGKELPLSDRDMYFPVTYTIPRAGNEAAIGFDLLSNPDRSFALEAAAKSGITRQSGAINLVQSGEPGFLLFNPIFQSELMPVSESARLATLRGFALGVIDIRELIESAIATTPGMMHFLGEVSIYEVNESNKKHIISVDTSNGSELSASIHTLAISKVQFGKSWVVELKPTRALVFAQYSSEHYIIGALGTVLSVLCGFLINMVAVNKIPKARSPQFALTDGNKAKPGLLKPSNKMVS